MMNSSSNEQHDSYVLPISSLRYRDVGAHLGFTDDMKVAQFDTKTSDEERMLASEREIEERINAARSDAALETEKRMKGQCEASSEEEAAKIARAIELFQIERKEYFTRVESDVVHLALAIAAKILHREAQVDTMLVAGLVRVAIDKLHDGSSVSVRVCSAEKDKWEKYLATPLNGSSVNIVSDDHLGARECVLETDLGSANFGIDAQMKEIEQGFFDLLAQRPLIK